MRLSHDSAARAASRIITRLLLVLPSMARIAVAGDPLPFNHKVEVYQNEKQGVTVFAVRLEQPFLAEEFEASNDLRLEPTDDKAYLIYPKEGRFRQKHAEFYGRLRGEGRTKLRLSYETVREKLDGSRQIALLGGKVAAGLSSQQHLDLQPGEALWRRCGRHGQALGRQIRRHLVLP